MPIWTNSIRQLGEFSGFSVTRGYSSKLADNNGGGGGGSHDGEIAKVTENQV